ncbi:RNA-directed DNA polymerase, eukaryota, reverse transcriptase zinc-binding domain protein [Tanacetum coccineum]|uniref:RNA-directed DNA polymerase, eukaryota, reverse transcriptase zinc-binding domain protein n=1 Tax=Tanacetum coccineum TaxID=301880 RepID=A0ABQ5F4E5_9ASTR
MDAEEHSFGISHSTNDMNEFKHVVNMLELEDICSSGFHFTWTKSLQNSNCNVLNKLDRMMINEEFMQKFPKAFGVFLPYLISDHSPAVMTIRDGVPKKQKSFRFSNFIAGKENFVEVVKKEWCDNIQGSSMYRFVKKLKLLKKPLNKLSWSKGNVFENVKQLRKKLKIIQAEVDKCPHDKKIKEEAILIIH